jgi:hypothetical protein
MGVARARPKTTAGRSLTRREHEFYCLLQPISAIDIRLGQAHLTHGLSVVPAIRSGSIPCAKSQLNTHSREGDS